MKFRCRCGHEYDERLGKYGCPNCNGDSGAARRPGPRERGYDSSWERVRKRFLAHCPTCQVRGCRRKAVHVDHIDPLITNPRRRLDASNLQGLCHAHHNLITAAYERGSLAGACDETGAPLDPTHPWAQIDNRAALEAVRVRQSPTPDAAARVKRAALRR